VREGEPKRKTRALRKRLHVHIKTHKGSGETLKNTKKKARMAKIKTRQKKRNESGDCASARKENLIKVGQHSSNGCLRGREVSTGYWSIQTDTPCCRIEWVKRKGDRATTTERSKREKPPKSPRGVLIVFFN